MFVSLCCACHKLVVDNCIYSLNEAGEAYHITWTSLADDGDDHG